MKKLIAIALLCLPISLYAQWSNIASNEQLSSMQIRFAIDSGFLYQIAPVDSIKQVWIQDSVVKYLAVDYNHLTKFNNQTISKSDLVNNRITCNDSLTAYPSSTIISNDAFKYPFYTGTSGVIMLTCDTNYLGGVGPGTINVYYNGGFIGGFSGPSNRDTSLNISFTYNSSVGPTGYLTISSENAKLYGPTAYRVFNVCSITNDITFSIVSGNFTVNYSQPTSGILTISGLSGAGYTNNTCTTGSGQSATQSGTYKESAVLASGTKNIPCSSCLTSPTTTYYEMGPTVVINGTSYSNGSTFTYNGQTYTVHLKNTCTAL